MVIERTDDLNFHISFAVYRRSRTENMGIFEDSFLKRYQIGISSHFLRSDTFVEYLSMHFVGSYNIVTHTLQLFCILEIHSNIDKDLTIKKENFYLLNCKT